MNGMGALFPSLPGAPRMADVFTAFPHTLRPLMEYHDRLMRDRSPLTVAQRELIAAYVSGVNACSYCYGAHARVARAFGIDEHVVAGVVADLEGSGVEEKMKPLLAYVGKLTRTPSRMTAEDAAAVYAAGWDERALFDGISVCALFNFMNRLVDGTGLQPNPSAPRAGGSPDAHEAPHSYAQLIELWNLSEVT